MLVHVNDDKLKLPSSSQTAVYKTKWWKYKKLNKVIFLYITNVCNRSNIV